MQLKNGLGLCFLEYDQALLDAFAFVAAAAAPAVASTSYIGRPADYQIEDFLASTAEDLGGDLENL